MRIIIAVVLCMLFSACSLNPPKSISIKNTESIVHPTPISPKSYLGYQPIDPLYVDSIKVYDESTDKMILRNWAALSNEQKRNLLPIQSSKVTLIDAKQQGAARFSLGSLSAESGNYTVIMDYMKYRVEAILDDKDKFLGNGKVGVGLRIKIDVETKKSKLNLASLVGIGLEASRGNLNGSISIDVIGIDSADVTNLIPLTAEIDQTSIQTTLQALASIKTKIFDDGSKVKITPHLVAVSEVVSNDESKVINTFVEKRCKP